MDEFQLVKTLLDGKKTKIKKLASTNLTSSKALKRKLYWYLSHNLTFVPIQNHSMLLQHIRSPTSLFGRRSDGKNFEVYPL